MNPIARTILLPFLVFAIGSSNADEAGPPSGTPLAITGRGKGQAYAFPFFYAGAKGETSGMWMAVSRDGLDWKIVNDNKVAFERPFGSVFRDPAISQGPDGIYHLVWTTDWDGSTGIGYARSTDLIHWEEPRQIDLMGSVPGTVNVWAPELFHDKDNQRWLIYWSSSVKGRYPETAIENRPRVNNRLYGAFTTDFKTTTGPKILFDAHIVNDTRIFNAESGHGKFGMVTKHITKPGRQAKLYLTYSENLAGPYRPTEAGFAYISDPYQFCEGPAVIKIGDWFHCYFDLSREHRMACKRSKTLDAKDWQDVTGQLTFPEDVKHGDIIRIPMAIYKQLLAL